MGELRSNPRKIDLMHRMFGRCEGRTCGECSNFVSGRYNSKILRKCRAYGLTHSMASDWARRWTACGLFNKEYSRPPVIELVKHNSFREKTPEEPLDGQITMEVSDMQDEGILRGEIYYVAIPYATGHEMEKDRPAIVVSCEELNQTSPCVAVVMCSASPKKELPEHITIRTTPVVSTALCEHIYTVDKSRLGKFVGRCTKAEIAALDIGIMSALALGAYDLARPVEAAAEAHPVEQPFPLVQPDMELAIAQMERDVYKSMYESLLDRMTMERRAGA